MWGSSIIIYRTYEGKAICWLYNNANFEVILIYTWLTKAHQEGSDAVCLLKDGLRGGSLSFGGLRGTGRSTGDCWRSPCPNLPTVYEVAVGEEDDLVLEEFIQGDTLDFLFGRSFSPGRR